MARNFAIQLLRGLLANRPTLSLGELYLATDSTDLYGGVTAGNARISTPAYSPAGVQLKGYHIVAGQVTLVGGTATITLTGSAVFTSAASYFVTATDATGSRACMVVRNSGTSFTISNTGGATDVINFHAIGN